MFFVLFSQYGIISKILHYSRELSNRGKAFEAPFQGAEAKPGTLGLDGLLLCARCSDGDLICREVNAG